MQELIQYLFSGITTGAIYAVIAVGFAVLYSATEFINFAPGNLSWSAPWQWSPFQQSAAAPDRGGLLTPVGLIA